MPSTEGLRLLVRLHVLKTDIELAGNKHARLRMTEEPVPIAVVYALARADYLVSCGPFAYELTQKGRDVAERPAAWKHQGMTLGLVKKTGKMLVHCWHEYLLVDQYVDFLSHCGLNMPSIFLVEVDTKLPVCPGCRVGYETLKNNPK